MRKLHNPKNFRLVGPWLALTVLATFAALALSADEPIVGANAAPATETTVPVAPADIPTLDPMAATTDVVAVDTTAPAAIADIPAEEPDAAADEVIPLKEDENTSIEPTGGQNLINVTVENETLENVVNMFARISGANIVTTSADLGGTVTVNLRGVEWKPALSSILDVHNLALIEKLPGSGVYTIVPKPAGEAEAMIVETMFLNYTTVTEMGPMARTMLGAVSNAALTEFPSRNAMVVRTTEANMREIQKLVSQMDVPGRQVIVETKFMELTDGASKKVGIRWDSLDEYGMSISPSAIYERTIERVSTRANDLTHSESSSSATVGSSQNSSSDTSDRLFDADGNQLEDTTFSIFDPNPNIDGDEVIIPETVPTTVNSTEASTLNSSLQNAQVSDSLSNQEGDTYNKTTTEAQSAILDFETFNMVISALEKTEGVSVISNPKIIVASGSKDAYFTVGDREPIIKTEIERGTQDSPGDTITAKLDTELDTEYIKKGYLETGIHLQVVPVVKTDDLIEASIEPKLVRRVLPDKVVGENSWPRIAVKEIKTTFTLRSGQTVAIGGLTDTSNDQKTSKIPLLGDIPLLGKYLFSHKADVKRQVETIIFVTLSLAEAQNLYREAGIPDEATLVHKQLIKREHQREVFDEELEQLRKAQEEESAERARSRTMKRKR